MRLFSGKHEGALGKCGDLCMRAEEFGVFKAAAAFVVQFLPEEKDADRGVPSIREPIPGRDRRRLVHAAAVAANEGETSGDAVMRTPGTRTCGGCRFWSEMIAKAQAGEVVAMCLGSGTMKGRYTTHRQTCDVFAMNSVGAVDDPPNYGEEVRAEYERQAALRHPNGAPVYAADGTMLDDAGNRSIFDDVDL